MKLSEDKVPATLDEALDMMAEGLEEHEREYICSHDPEEVAGDVHFFFGRSLRNNWSLWEKDTPLVLWFKSIGITHPDDISGIINVSFCRKVRGEELRVAEQVQHYQSYWIKEIGRSIP